MFKLSSWDKVENTGKSKFQIKVADYNIQIPKLVREKIAKIVDVDTQLTLKKK